MGHCVYEDASLQNGYKEKVSMVGSQTQQVGDGKRLDLDSLRLAYLVHQFVGFSSCRDVLMRLSAVQIDPVSVVAPNHHLALGARVPFCEEELNKLYDHGTVFEAYAKCRCIIPAELAPLFQPLFEIRKDRFATEFETHADQVRYILSNIEENGSISADELESDNINATDKWGPKRLHTQLLNILWQTGQIVVCRRRGREVRYALAPTGMQSEDDTATESRESIRLDRWQRYLDGAGIVDTTDAFLGFERATAVERRNLVNEMIDRGWAEHASPMDSSLVVSRHLMPEAQKVGALKARFVPPLDTSIWNRRVAEKLFGFRYKWEIYVPDSQRVCGPYAMPLVSVRGFSGPVDVGFDSRSRTIHIRPQKAPIWGNPVPTHDELDEAADQLARSVGADRISFE
jgi:uncharacterized protein YcaQ